MEKILCEVCNKSFKRKLSQVRYFKHHYCSKSCHYKARKLGIYTKCANCQKPIYKAMRAVRASKNKKFFCGKKCSNIVLGQIQSRANHPNWTTGKASYKAVMKRSSLKCECVRCGRNDKRILSVHHIDHNRQNNNLRNLVWMCRNCHHLVHNYK